MMKHRWNERINSDLRLENREEERFALENWDWGWKMKIINNTSSVRSDKSKKYNSKFRDESGK